MDNVSLLGPPTQSKVLNQDEFDSRFNFVRYKKKKTNCELFQRIIINNFSSYHSAKDLMPFLSWIRTYDVKASAVRDIFGSLLIASMLIPQGVMNGMLSSDIPAGILSILLPHIVYPFFGSARHCSLGSFSIMSFLVYSSLRHTGSTVATLTFYCGLFQIIHFAFPLEFVLSFVSTNLLLGFHFGVALRILLHLLPMLLNVHTEQCDNILNSLSVDSVSHCLLSMDYVPLAMFTIALTTLLAFKWKLNAFISDTIGTTIPHELIVMLFAALASYFLELAPSTLLPVKAESMFAAITLPSLPNSYIIVDAFAIFLFIMVSHIKAVSSRSQQSVNKKQELFCTSIISLLSSPFGLLPVASSMHGSQIDCESWNYSLMSNILSTLWMALTLYFIRPIVELIPSSVVIAMILSAVTDAWTNLRHLRVLCSSHTCDAMIFICAVLCALLVQNLNVAFLEAVAIALLSIAIRTQWPRCEVVVRATENSFIEENRYEHDDSDTPLRILRLSSPLVFINCETIREQIQKQAAAVKSLFETGMESRTPSMRSQPVTTVHESGESRRSLIVITHDAGFLQANPSDSETLKYIVLDCFGVAYVDPEAVRMLSQVFTELRDGKIKMMFAGFNASIRDFLEISRFFDVVPRACFFPTLQEALGSLRNMNFPFHMSVSMNGYRDVVTLSTAPSHLDISCHSPEPA